MSKLDKNQPVGKGFRTAYQAVAGMVIAYFTGLLAIPEVREYTTIFIQQEGLATLLVVLASFGIGGGLFAFIQNKIGK